MYNVHVHVVHVCKITSHETKKVLPSWESNPGLLCDRRRYTTEALRVCVSMMSIHMYTYMIFRMERRLLAEREEVIQELHVRAEEEMELQKLEYESRLRELGDQMVSTCSVAASDD